MIVLSIVDFLAEHAAMIGLLFFFSFFSLMGFWTFRPGSKEGYEKQALIPLEENE